MRQRVGVGAPIPPNPFMTDAFLTQGELDAMLSATDPAIYGNGNNGASEPIDAPLVGEPGMNVDPAAHPVFRILQVNSVLSFVALAAVVGAGVWVLTRGR